MPPLEFVAPTVGAIGSPEPISKRPTFYIV